MTPLPRLAALFFLAVALWLPAPTRALSAPAAEEGWRAGAASVDITPGHPVRLSGYGNRTTVHEGVEMRLHAKALALTWLDGPPAVILTVDNCGVPAVLRAEVLARVQKAGWPLLDARFSLHSSHTHCAPALPHLLTFLFTDELPSVERGQVERYAAFLKDQLTAVVIAALEAREPARLDWSQGKTRFAMNRRLVTPAGLANSPNVHGPVDHALPVLRVTSAQGKLLAIHTSYACHCTTLAINKTHPDWAGCAQQVLEQRFPGAVALTAIGCGADQNPYPRRELEMAMRHGTTLADEATRLVKGAMTPLHGPLNCAAQEIKLPFDTLPDAAGWRQLAQQKSPQAARLARHYLGMVERGEPLPTSLPYLVQVWSFSDEMLTINLPGEVVVDYSLRFKRENDPARTWVNSYTNDVPCYIPSQRVWEEGGYEGAGAMVYYGRPTRFASGVEDMIVKAANELIPPRFKAPAR